MDYPVLEYPILLNKIYQELEKKAEHDRMIS